MRNGGFPEDNVGSNPASVRIIRAALSKLHLSSGHLAKGVNDLGPLYCSKDFNEIGLKYTEEVKVITILY